MKQQLAEVNRFAFSGLLVAGIDFITFIALQSAGLERVKANGIAMLVGFIAGFFYIRISVFSIKDLQTTAYGSVTSLYLSPILF